MKVVCAWCGKTIREKDDEDVEGVSHGVCDECLDKLQANGEWDGAKNKQDEQQA